MFFNKKIFNNTFKGIAISSLLFSCQPKEQPDPAKELSKLVSPYGFIGFQNAMDRGESGTHTGILVGGRPNSLVYVSNHESCFPTNEELPRYQDRANINRTYHYSFEGNLGFLTLGLPIVSASLGLSKSHTVDIELNGLVIEYMDSIDVTDWYREGINPTCREYLNDFGFLIQTIHTDSMKLSIKRTGGTNVGLNLDNIGNYFQFEAGVHWELIDNYTVEITTPHTLGYQIALMKPEDHGRSLYRAMSVKDNNFIFEKIGFSDFFEQTASSNNGPSKALNDQNMVFKD